MTQPSGWYSDPDNDELLRYFDGVIWTNNTRPKKLPEPEPQKPAAGSSRPGTSEDPYAGPAGPQGWGAQGGGQWGGASGGQQWGAAPPYGQQPPPYGQQPPPHGQQPYPQGYQGYPPQGYPGWYAPAGPRTPDGEELASWGRRLGAWLIDGFIISILVGIIAAIFLADQIDTVNEWFSTVVEGDFEAATQMPEAVSRASLWLSLSSAISWLLYEVIFLSAMSTTPGKRLLGMFVRPLESRDRLSPKHIGTRVLAKVGPRFVDGVPLVSLLTSIFSLVDHLWPLWDQRRQALHDRFAGTVVVRRR